MDRILHVGEWDTRTAQSRNFHASSELRCTASPCLSHAQPSRPHHPVRPRQAAMGDQDLRDDQEQHGHEQDDADLLGDEGRPIGILGLHHLRLEPEPDAQRDDRGQHRPHDPTRTSSTRCEIRYISATDTSVAPTATATLTNSSPAHIGAA
ncbi:hypothetical protein ACFV4K_29005 [Nocardia sp. NPDC059764]|uniref:hypothetical protein n=1 Tax=Nocardia sp. NPDC059764 TaxID=3346939 RepID=UPI00364CDF52